MTARVYLDYNATAPLRPAAQAAMLAALSDAGNPSSPHAEGQRARAAIELARCDIAALVNADRREVIFTSGATEALNLAVFSAARARLDHRDHVVVSAIEHDAVLESAEALSYEGLRVTQLPVTRDGAVQLDHAAATIDARTALVAVMLANNELGVIQPVEQLQRLASSVGALMLVDAVQAVGRVNVDFRGLGADYLALSSHKLGGPMGVGALIVRRGAAIEAILHGGGQERGLRAGTENVPAIVGFAAAAREVRGRWVDEARRVDELRARCEHQLCKALPGSRINGSAAHRLPGTISLTIPHCDAQSLVVRLDQDGIAVSTGAACASGAAESSHVLRAIGLTSVDVAATIRISLGWDSRDEHINALLAALPAAVAAQHRAGVVADEHLGY